MRLEKVPGAENVLTGDLADMEETKQLAEKVNALGRFDAIIHNAGVYRESDELIFKVNTLAPYILTCLIQKPKRLIYLSSGSHMCGNPQLKNMETGSVSYADSKLHDVIFKLLLWPANGPMCIPMHLNPGWVPTKMGGAGAPGNLQKGYETQVWLAVSNDEEAKVSGHYFYHKKQKHHVPEAADADVQEKFLELCEKITGVEFPVE